MLTHTTSATLLVAMLGAGAYAGVPYDGVIAFGDSLTDNGNLFAATGVPPAPYWEGRFSDGPVWVEHVVGPLELDGSALQDLAVGGSTTALVLERVTSYLDATSGTFPANHLCVYWAGANDLFALQDDPTLEPAEVIASAMANTTDALLALAGAGATDIVVLNLPNLGRTPNVLAANDPAAAAAATAVSAAYDDALAAVITGVESATGLSVTRIDVFALLEAVADDPVSYRLSNVTDPAFDGTTVVDEPHRYLFWDGVHPTTAGHLRLARHVLAEIGFPVTADVTGNYVIDVGDLVAVVLGWGACDGDCPADVDGNGVVDGLDIAAVVEAWDP